MKIKQLGDNHSLLMTNHFDEILYNGETPVAGFKMGIGFFKNRSTEHTSQVRDYLRGVDDVTLLLPEEIAALFLTGE